MQGRKNKNVGTAMIPAYQFHAIKMRYSGQYTYKQMVEEINKKYGVTFSVEAIQSWFGKRGSLGEAYRQYADEMMALEIEEAQDFIKGNVSKAAKTLAAVMMGKGGPAQVMAAKEFLDRGIGRVTEKLQVAGVLATINAEVKEDGGFAELFKKADDDTRRQFISSWRRIFRGGNQAGNLQGEHTGNGGAGDIQSEQGGPGQELSDGKIA
jgi:hypothetical protein